MRPRILRPAQVELRDAVRWYEERGAGLGHALRDEVLARLRFLCELPFSAPAWIDDPSFRCSTLHRFPYRVFYFIDDDELVVVAVAHDRREPGYWRSRVG